MQVPPADHRTSVAAPAVCAAWFGTEPPEVGAAIDPGFSGSPLFRVRSRHGGPWFVLKAFAEGTTWARARWVHALVAHLSDRGISEVPRPCPARHGDTIVADAAGVLWELVPFVDGVAVATPTKDQVTEAIVVLARLHRAAARFPSAPPAIGRSPGLVRRIDQAQAIVERPWHARLEGVTHDDPLVTAMAGRWERAITHLESPIGRRAVAAIASRRADAVPLQAVLRDVWTAHVLFSTEDASRVAGIVDPHAAAVDTPATDLARLLGGWLGGGAASDPLAAWPAAVTAYEATRPLSGAERGLVPLLHAAGVIYGLDNWFRWACEEHRRFTAPATVLARVDRLLGDLPSAIGWLADLPDPRV